MADRYTVRLRLKAPDASLILAFTDRAGMMVSPAAVQKLGDQFGRQPVGAGEFRMARWQPGSEVRMERFADYYEPGRPYLDGILIRIMPDGDTRVTALRSGQVDFIMEVPAQDFASLKGERNLRAIEGPTLAYWRVFLNMGKAPLERRRRARRSTSRSTPTLLRTIIFGLGEVVASPFPAGYWAHNPSLKPGRPARSGAREGQAGRGRPAQRLHDGHGARAHAGARAARGGHPGAVGRGRHQGGSQADGPGQGRAVLLPGQGADGGNYRWTGRPDPDQSVRGMFHSTGFYNPGGHKVARIEELMDQAKATYRQEDRRRIYQQLSEVIQQEAMDTGIYVAYSLEAMNATLQGYQPNFLGKPMFRGVWLQGK